MIREAYLVVARIIDNTNNLVGFRVVEVSSKRVNDVKADMFENAIRTGKLSILNAKVNAYGSICFATTTGNLTDFPALTATGRRLLTQDIYTISNSDHRGNLVAYNAHGERVIIQPREYLRGLNLFTNAKLENGALVGIFNTQRIDLSYFEQKNECVPVLVGNFVAF